MKLCVLATGVADALGEPFEQSPTAIREDHPLPALDTWNGEYAPGRFGPGVWTDDTGMTVALARSLLDRKGYEAPAVADAYLDWYRGIDARGTGATVEAAMDALAEGATYDTSGVRTGAGYVGNGTVMRCAPIGFYGAHHGWTLGEVARVAALDARITHAAAEAEAGSTAVAAGVFALARGECDLPGLPAFLLATLDQFEYRWTRVRSLLTAVELAVKNDTPYDRFAARVGRAGDVATTVATALLCASRFWPAFDAAARAPVEAAVRMRGDADSRAVVTAVWCGAAGGIDAFPRSWLLHCKDADVLFALDQELLGVQPVRAVHDVLNACPVTRV